MFLFVLFVLGILGKSIVVDDLYEALLDAKEVDGIIRLPGNVLFPVELEDGSQNYGSTLIVRQAQRDLWKLFEEYVLNENVHRSMLCLGPPGIGKSWAGMFFLIQAIQRNCTVVFESAAQKTMWVFSRTGSRTFFAADGTCEELRSKSTIHIFDAKAGGREPVQSKARLILLSSTNDTSYKQTAREKVMVMGYPSTTEHEFYGYAKVLGVDNQKLALISDKCGTGKVRSLVVSESDALGYLETALRRMKIDNFIEYMSDSSPAEIEGMDRVNPSTLFDLFPSTMEYPKDQSIGSKSKPDSMNELYFRYLFRYCNRTICSYYVTRSMIAKHQKQIQSLVADFYSTIGKSGWHKTVGPVLGVLFENVAPYFIAEQGLQCDSFESSDRVFEIPRNLKVVNEEVTDVLDVLKTMTDETKLYSFGKNMPGFDAFIPPNIFIQFASSIQDDGFHPLNFDTFNTCGKYLRESGNGKFYVILAIPDAQKSAWTKMPSLKITNAEIVKDIRSSRKLPQILPEKVRGSNDASFEVLTAKGEQASESEKTLKSSSVIRKYEKLPSKYQGNISKMKVCRGVVSLAMWNFQSNRSFATSASSFCLQHLRIHVKSTLISNQIQRNLLKMLKKVI